MKIYLAARFGRKDELLGYKEQIESREGFEVTSRWLLGGHEWSGVPDEEIPPEESVRFAVEDLDDIAGSGLMICFTEPDRSHYSRGGRHVEFGYALGIGLHVVVIGPRENVFYCLDRRHPHQIVVVPSFAAFLDRLDALESELDGESYMVNLLIARLGQTP